MNQFKRYLKKYWILFSTFILINTFFISVITNILSLEQDIKTRNSLISKEAKSILFETSDEVSISDLINIFEDRNVILESTLFLNNDDRETNIVGVYYNYSLEKSYPLSDGRMFTLEEIEDREKVALVGYNLKDQMQNETIKVEGEEYKVVGILGNKSNITLGDSIYINMNSQDFKLNRKNITIDMVDGSISYFSREIYDKLNETNNVVMEISEPIVEPLYEAISSNSMYLIMGFLACLSLIFTVINISSYWVEKEKSIIGIKSLVGGSRKAIIVDLFIEYQCVILVSIGVAYSLFAVLGKLVVIDFTITLKSLIIITLIDLIISSISVIPSIIKINKMNINSIIKERI